MMDSGSDGAGSRAPSPRYLVRLYSLIVVFLLLIGESTGSGVEPDSPIVFTQLRVHARAETEGPVPLACDGGRIVMLTGEKTRVLTRGFHSACDPDVSFDGKRILFSGKKKASDPWNIFEMDLGRGQTRQITRDLGNCRNPVYQGRLFTLDSPEPWYQITFVSDAAGEINEHGSTPSTSLYTVRMDGSGAERLTYNPSSDLDPGVLPDGRLIFASWQRASLDNRGVLGRVALFASQIDGVDYALFTGEGSIIQRMPCVTDDRRVVFVENDEPTWDGAGTLGMVSLRRNLHSYEKLTTGDDGLFHSPSPFPGHRVLISRRPASGDGTHGVFVLDPESGRTTEIYDDPGRDDVQAKVVTTRPRPDGRSTVVTPGFETGVMYGLNVYDSDLGATWVPSGTPVRLRVLEGVPRKTPAPSDEPPVLPRRFLGEVAVEQDGSFNVQVPANTPIQIQLVDEDGLALRSCGWIWVRNRETRGCIGCHEDGERTPENRFVRALEKPSIPLDLPRRRDEP